MAAILIQFEKKPLLFTDPKHIISCFEPSKIPDAFKDIEQLLKDGFFVAGFLSYEAGYCFEKRLSQTRKYAFPLLWMGAFKKPDSETFHLKKSDNYQLSDLHLNISPTHYASNIEKIRRHIADGNVYQITYCIKMRFTFKGNPQALYVKLLRDQPVPYPAYIETDEFQILSLSPERFMKKIKDHIITEPMKGTWRRGNHPFSDMLEYFQFQNDGKNRAENVMIADLLRNDLGRIGKQVVTPKLFTVSPYKTLFQMTSTVTAQVPKDIPLITLFSALFPSGSVTGAPKIRAMEIIRDIEQEERNIYTGAIGYMTPTKDFYFNVPIRTLLIRDQLGEMGIGGGIVWDSTSDGEWNEGMLKSRFLINAASR
ncbi:MAG: aminodeoxychorismate synthase component I [Candidatus Omnitrophica bacterium]|nr:aminodeoxychorismate synthase component I [Candidatus Omnitrophota bacterium]